MSNLSPLPAPLLEVRDLNTFLGESHIIQGVSFDVPRSKVVALLGRNGAGKTTTLRSIMRLAKPRSGEITLNGQRVDKLAPYAIARLGVSLVHETRAIFPSLSVEENLAIAARGNGPWTIEKVYEDFPVLAARRRNGGTQLSGGEQQMLAIARALVGNPQILLLDEPTEGLAPLIVRQIGELILKLKETGMTMLLVEQNFALATRVADEVVVLGKGRVRWRGAVADFADQQDIKHTWLGV